MSLSESSGALDSGMTRDKKGTIKIGGVSVADIASEFGTPLYVYDAKRIRENYERLRSTLALHFAPLRANVG